MRRNAMALSRKQTHRKQEKQTERNRKRKLKKSFQSKETNGKEFSVHVLHDNYPLFS